jgi:hypothetical protein
VAGGGGGGKEDLAVVVVDEAFPEETSLEGVDARLLLLVFSLGVSDLRFSPPFFLAAAFLKFHFHIEWR